MSFHNAKVDLILKQMYWHVAILVTNPRDILNGKIGFVFKNSLQKKNFINYMSG